MNITQEMIDWFPVMRWFRWEHLPPHLQDTSRPIGLLACEYAAKALRGEADIQETVAGLRKLKEAKDCLVCAALNPPTTGDK